MATTMKSSTSAIEVMQQMLQERCIAEPMFAIKMANPQKSMEGAVNYLCKQIQKSGLCVVDDTTVLNLLTHYFDENEIEERLPTLHQKQGQKSMFNKAISLERTSKTTRL